LAVSPLMVYYSQEARMYTLLVLEASLASYLLFKILHPTPPTSRKTTQLSLPLLYALTAAAALYTHYFAVFLLAAHGLYAEFVLWQQHWSKRVLSQTLVMFGLTALLFVPWLPTLFSRLGDDPSYWPGALKLNEAIRKVAISFTVGETVFEQTGFWLALAYMLILFLCGLWALANLGLNSPSTQSANQLPSQPTVASPTSDSPHPATIQNSQFIIHRSLLFLLLWLLIPPLLILLLSYQSPKFNPRYTLLSWPAFALILAAALASLLHPKQVTVTPSLEVSPAPPASGQSLPAGRVTLYALRTFFTLSLVFIFATSAFSLYNWFADPRFSKDDFQALAQFVRERSTGDETVLLSSGHLFPVWAYYYGWENWTPLPWMQRLDVNRVTDLSIAADIAEAIAGKEGVWLVTWQNEVIDPNGVVPFWLDRIGDRPGDAGDFWGVGLEHWRLNPTKAELLRHDPIEWPLAINFDNQVELVGMTQLSDTELALFWQARQPLPEDLILTLDLTDSDGHDWDRDTVVGPVGSFFYPPARWPVGQIIMTRHRLPWQIGTPPGLYQVEIGLGQVAQSADHPTDFVGWDLLDEQGRPQRRTALLDFVNLSRLVEPENGPLPLDQDPLVDFFPIVGVRRSILPQKSAEPGDRILLALLWQAGEFNLDDISVAFDLVDAAGQTFRVGSSLTPSRRFNLPRWDPGDVVLGQYWLAIPAQAAAGPATLQLHLITIGAYGYDEVFPFDQLEILPTKRNFTPPTAVDMPLEADFSGQATLIGVDCANNCRAKPGDSVALTFYWRADNPLEKNYTVFTHLLGPGETVVVNADHAPPKPVPGWVPGEIITDPVTLNIPVELPAGDYALEVGLYDAADPALTRLPLTNGDTRLLLPQPLRLE